MAADLPIKAPVAPVAVATTWTGFYLGIAGGYGWGSTRHTNEITGINSGVDDGLKGGIVGLTYGYNWQTGPFVLGLEGDISWADINDTFHDNNGSGFCTIGSCMTKVHWLGTDRLRLGYAWDRFLVYGTAGVAYGAVEATIAEPVVALFTDETHTRAGWTAGGGIEGKLWDHWSAKVEYLYVDLGDQHGYQFIAPPNTGERVLARFSMVRAGLNYHFW